MTDEARRKRDEMARTRPDKLEHWHCEECLKYGFDQGYQQAKDEDNYWSEEKCPCCKGPVEKRHEDYLSTNPLFKVSVYTVWCKDKECGMSYLPKGQEHKIDTFERKALRKERDQLIEALKFIGHECMNNETCPTREHMIEKARATLKELGVSE